jgi:hypothetical protein
VRGTGLGDPAVAGGLAAGLPDPRVEPEVADQPVRRPEPDEVTDRRHDRQRDRRVDSGDGHQPQHFRPFQGSPAQVSVDQPEFTGVEVQLPPQGAGGVPLVRRQILPREPVTALDPEQVRGRAARHQVAAKIACTWFFSRVRCRTICARCSTCRHSALVAASGIHTGGRKSAASSCARIAA